MPDVTREVLLQIVTDARQSIAQLRALAAETQNANAARQDANTAERQQDQQRTRRARSIQDVAAGLFVLRSGYAAVTGAVRGLTATGQQFFNTFIRGNEELQKSAVSTAAAIVSSNNVFDDNGNLIEDSTEAIERLVPALQAARQEVVQLAADIPGITETDIQPVFENLAGSVGELGLEVRELPELAANTAAAFQVLNVPLFQARQEIQSLIRGEVNRNTEIANRLGLQAEDLKQARERGELGEFLNEQFAAAGAGAGLLADLTENATSNLETILDRIARRLGEPFLEPIQQGLLSVVEFLAGNEDRIVGFFTPIAEELVTGTRRLVEFGQQALQVTQPLLNALRESVRAVRDFVAGIAETGIVQLFQDLSIAILEGLVNNLTRAVRVVTLLIDAARPLLRIVQAQVEVFRELVNVITLGSLAQAEFNREIRRGVSDVNQLSDAVTKLNSGIALNDRELRQLQRSLEDAYGEGAQQIFDRFLARNEEIKASLEEQETVLQSQREAREDAEQAEELAFQQSQNRFNVESDLRRDEIEDLKEVEELVSDVAKADQSRLDILNAAVSLERQRGQRRISLLEEESNRLREQGELLEQEGASRARIRRNERQQREVTRQLADERIQLAENERQLQLAQNQAQAAQIESQRVLNQLKIDQLEIENELAQIQLRQERAGIEREIEEGEDLTPAELSALEDRLRGVDESIARTQRTAGRFGQQREAIDAAAASAAQALGISAQAQEEAFLNQLGQLLVERGDPEARRIAESRRLDPLERDARLQERAADVAGVTISTPEVMVSPEGATAQVQVEAPQQQQQQRESMQPIVEELRLIRAAIPSAQDIVIANGQETSITGATSQTPSDIRLVFSGSDEIRATGN